MNIQIIPAECPVKDDGPNKRFKMRVGFIGAGKVALPYGRYLYGHAITVSGYHDRHKEKLTRAATLTRSQAFENGAQAACNSDILLIATRDDQIAGVCTDLCRQGTISADHLVGHLSGAHSSEILAPAAAAGAAVFSLHPLQAFANEETALRELKNTYFSVEGTDPRLSTIEELLAITGNRCLRLLPEHKRLYHLTACIFSNYLVTLISAGMQALEKSGIDPREGFEAMLPLIEGTITNIIRTGPAKALTGPIARGDAGTIRQHLEALTEHNLTDLKSFYRFMGVQTLTLAMQAILTDPLKIDHLQQILNIDDPS
jgi:predicted short-subunit dehydrogenase-like oxidoreductase (DUF2520 family)